MKFSGLAQIRKNQVETDHLPELRRQNCKCEEVNTFRIHRADYQREKSWTTAESKPCVQLRIDQHMQVRKLPKAGGKKTLKILKGTIPYITHIV